MSELRRTKLGVLSGCFHPSKACHLSQASESQGQTTNRENTLQALGSQEVTMARLIPFYVPQNFKPPKNPGQPLEQRGKLIEFQNASIKKSA